MADMLTVVTLLYGQEGWAAPGLRIGDWCHGIDGETFGDKRANGERLRAGIEAVRQQAIVEERERCARVAEEEAFEVRVANPMGVSPVAVALDAIARAIRTTTTASGGRG